MQLDARNRIETDESAHHEDITVGEVDQAHDAVDHGISQGDQGIYEAQLQSVDDLLKEEVGFAISATGAARSTTTSTTRSSLLRIFFLISDSTKGGVEMKCVSEFMHSSRKIVFFKNLWFSTV